jgi:hypothetical protein
MRWRRTPPRAGDTRTRARFLWLPMTLDGETRWLERARVLEQFGLLRPGTFDGRKGWNPVGWLINEKGI